MLTKLLKKAVMSITNSTMSNCTINGVRYSGKSVSIINGRVIIDGVEQADDLTGRPITVTVEGDVDKIELDSGTVIAQDVGNINTMSGDVDCSNVTGSISTMSGDVECLAVGGKISTMSGDIKHR